MIQKVFLTLLIMALFSGAFYITLSYIFNTKEGSGPIFQLRHELKDLALDQIKFLDTLQGQQQMLNKANKDADHVLLESHKQGEKDNKAVLQLEALRAEIQDKQRLMTAHAQDLIEEERQKQEDHQSLLQQRIADQKQRMQDQQNK